MMLTNVTGLPASWTMGFQRDGREMLIVIVKATYSLPESGEEAKLAPTQLPLIEADQFTGEPGVSAPLYETDFAHIKRACDVLLIGSAYAPPGRAVTRLEVGLRVGSLVKQFAVIGPRVWHRSVLSVAPGEPEPFTSLRITYDCAFGGIDETQVERGRTETYLPNPVGRGYRRHFDRIDGQPLPNTEEIRRPVDKPNGTYIPMAFSPIGRSWQPRARYAGTYDQAWLENVAPLWPDDFDERYFQAAPPDQTMPYPQGGEPVVLLNLTPDGRRAFRLPSVHVPMTFIPYQGEDITRDASLDTIVLEPDQNRFTLAWRVALPLARSVFDVRETIVGEMSSAWHRARRYPGKIYYSSLRELVAARRSGGARS
jgi:hypothetical protein